MKTNAIVTIIFFIFTVTIPTASHAALAEPGLVSGWNLKGSILKGTSAFFFNWLKNKKADTLILKTMSSPEKLKKPAQMPLSQLEQQLNAYRLVSVSA